VVYVAANPALVLQETLSVPRAVAALEGVGTLLKCQILQAWQFAQTDGTGGTLLAIIISSCPISIASSSSSRRVYVFARVCDLRQFIGVLLRSGIVGSDDSVAYILCQIREIVYLLVAVHAQKVVPYDDGRCAAQGGTHALRRNGGPLRHTVLWC